jgi:hypothetical protein
MPTKTFAFSAGSIPEEDTDAAEYVAECVTEKQCVAARMTNNDNFKENFNFILLYFFFCKV